jgi:hypothetical protein
MRVSRHHGPFPRQGRRQRRKYPGSRTDAVKAIAMAYRKEAVVVFMIWYRIESMKLLIFVGRFIGYFYGYML